MQCVVLFNGHSTMLPRQFQSQFNG